MKTILFNLFPSFSFNKESRFIYFAAGQPETPAGEPQKNEHQPIDIHVDLDAIMREGNKMVEGPREEALNQRIQALDGQNEQLIYKAVKSLPPGEQADAAYRLVDQMNAARKELMTANKGAEGLQKFVDHLQNVNNQLVALQAAGKLNHKEVEKIFAIKMEGVTFSIETSDDLDKQGKVFERHTGRIQEFVRRSRASLATLGLSPQDAERGATALASIARQVYEKGGVDNMNRYLEDVKKAIADARYSKADPADAWARVDAVKKEYL